MAAGKASNFRNIYVPDDEAIFQLNGNVSNHNVVRYAPRDDPPEDFVYDKPSSGKNLVVWIGLARLARPSLGHSFMTGTSMAKPIWKCF